MNRLGLWTSIEVREATGGVGGGEWTCSGIAIDSRAVQPGDLFVALVGPNNDAHDYVANALSAGAVAALVHRRPEGLPADAPLIEVGDTLEALNAMARARRAYTAAAVVAITGSVGKTGTKEALRRVLCQQAPTHANIASFNNHWGVPLSLARLPRDARFAIFELGMNAPGEIRALSRLVRPHLAIITTVEAAHLAFFESVEQIADAKAEIFEGLVDGGTALINADNAYAETLREAAVRSGAGRVLGFGAKAGADARLINAVLHATSSTVSADIIGQAVTYKVGAPGRHWTINAVAVLAAAKLLGADIGMAALALADLSPPKGRGERHQVRVADGAFELIDESYNANPASVRAALELLAMARPGPNGRRIAVLGDMLELGSEAPRLHREVADEIKQRPIDMVYACGEQAAHMFQALPQDRRVLHTELSADLVAPLVEQVRAGDVVMVKGSLGVRMAPIVEALLARGAGDAVAFG
ncbi:MAG: UDP-N-acetylmuramoylalanyl-D-glutamyl-2,6-diaminopimelate--D-alanyl-D-alanine ligase [Alphaproteobacteria bacterium]